MIVSLLAEEVGFEPTSPVKDADFPGLWNKPLSDSSLPICYFTLIFLFILIVLSAGIEPTFQPSEGRVLSIKLQKHLGLIIARLVVK